MIVFNYKSKKELAENIGNRLNYIETSMFGDEYLSNGVLTGQIDLTLLEKAESFLQMLL